MAKRATVIFGGMTVLFGNDDAGPHPSFRLGGFSYEMSSESLLGLNAFLAAHPEFTPALNGGDMTGLITALQAIGIELAVKSGSDPVKIKEKIEAVTKPKK